jgi:hypothetical protein
VYHSHPYSSMRLTFVTDLGQTYTVEIDPKMELENVMALLEAEVSDSRVINVSPKLMSFLVISPVSRSLNRVSRTIVGN